MAYGTNKLMTPGGGGVIITPGASVASDVTVTIPAVTATVDAFASGTTLLFQQTSAPTGWTKVTTYNDYALRVVSGTASTGGSVAFSTAFSSGLSAGATTLSTSQIPAHAHNFTYDAAAYPYPGNNTCPGSSYTTNTQNAGGGGSHTHTLPSFAVNYVDVIIASKN